MNDCVCESGHLKWDIYKWDFGEALDIVFKWFLWKRYYEINLWKKAVSEFENKPFAADNGCAESMLYDVSH